MKKRHAVVAVFGAVAILATVVTSAYAYQRPGSTTRVSVASDGTQADINASPPKYIPNSLGTVSGNGRYVVFEGWAHNLVKEHQEGIVRPHIFRHDLVTRETVRVTLRPDGYKSAQGGRGATISRDGRFIAYNSASTDLVDEPDTNRGTDIFVTDMETRKTVRVSKPSSGEEGTGPYQFNNNSMSVDISPDGRYVSFFSHKTNLVEGDTNGTTDIFLHDLANSTTERISVASDGSESNDTSINSVVSEGGRFVTFDSYATNLDGGAPVVSKIFIRDRQAGTTERLPIAGDAEPNGEAGVTAISADGRYVVFDSDASNLVPYDSNAAWDTFVFDRATGITTRVSVASDGTEANANTFARDISSDGRYVVMVGGASTLVPDDTNGREDVFVHDRVLGKTERVSVADDGSQGNKRSLAGSISDDGRIVAFDSDADNLVPNDTNFEKDIFVRDRGPHNGFGQLDVDIDAEAGSAAISGWSSFNGAVLATAEGEPGDAGLPLDLSADLVGAQLIARPEDQDVQLRLDLDSLSSTAAPGVVYGFRFTAAGTPYEIRGNADTPATPRFELLRCEDTCTHVDLVRGRYGRTGNNVLVTIPEDLWPAAPGDALTDLEAFTALGASVATLQNLDSLDMADTTMPGPRVQAAVAPAGDEPTGWAPIELEEGVFGGTLELGSLPDGEHHVWVRSCLAGCDARAFPFTIGEPESNEPLGTALEVTTSKVRGDTYVTARLTSENGDPLGGLPLSFLANGSVWTVQTTDDDGRATALVPKKGATAKTVEIVFEGTDDYAPSRTSPN